MTTMIRTRMAFTALAALPLAVSAWWISSTAVELAASAAAMPQPKIVRVDPRFDQLVPADAEIEKIADGLNWVEGPVWNPVGKYLLFSDIPTNAVYKWQEGTGVRLFLKPSGYTGSEPFPGREPGANGLAFDPHGHLVLCEHGDRRISRLEPDGTRTTLADRYRGKRLNSPNDAIFDSKGNLYFTDPPFGLPRAFDDPGRELDFSGVYRLSPDGRLTLLTKGVRAPNGIAFSLDERRLYVSNADPSNAVWLAFDVRPDGALARRRVFFDASSWAKTRQGAPDGIKVDKDGNLFTAGPGGLHIFAPDGTHLGSIETGSLVSNCAWGGDGSVLYITAGKAVYRVRVNTRGARL